MSAGVYRNLKSVRFVIQFDGVWVTDITGKHLPELYDGIYIVYNKRFDHQFAYKLSEWDWVCEFSST